MSKYDCKRCGLCCKHLGPGWFRESKHPLIKAIDELLWLIETETTHLPDDGLGPMGSCAMLVYDDDGIATCLIWKYLGEDALPETCREFPTGEDYDGDCEGVRKRVLAEIELNKLEKPKCATTSR